MDNNKFLKLLNAAKECVRENDKVNSGLLGRGQTLSELGIPERILSWNWRPRFGMFLKDLCVNKNTLVYHSVNDNNFILSVNEYKNPCIYVNDKWIPGHIRNTKFISFSDAVRKYYKYRRYWRAKYKKGLKKHTETATAYYKEQRQIKKNPYEIAFSEELYTKGRHSKEIEKEFQSYQNCSRTTDLLESLRDDQKYFPMKDLVQRSINIKNKSGFGGAFALCAYDLGRQAVLCELEALGLDKKIITELRRILKLGKKESLSDLQKKLYNIYQKTIKNNPDILQKEAIQATASEYIIIEPDFSKNHLKSYAKKKKIKVTDISYQKKGEIARRYLRDQLKNYLTSQPK